MHNVFIIAILDGNDASAFIESKIGIARISQRENPLRHHMMALSIHHCIQLQDIHQRTVLLLGHNC